MEEGKCTTCFQYRVIKDDRIPLQHSCTSSKHLTESAAVQESFFNRGAASEEWIAPERRVRHINVPAVRASHMPWLASQPSTPARARQVEVPADRISHMPWLASQPSTPAIARRVDVPANRISHMPWLGSEPSTPGSARRANAPAGRNSRAPWLPSEPSTPTAVRPLCLALKLLSYSCMYK